MLIPNANFQLLTSVLVLLRPLGVVLSGCLGQRKGSSDLAGDNWTTYFMISLSLIMRFTSWIIAALTHTNSLVNSGLHLGVVPSLTLFADQGVIAVVGVVRISNSGAAAIGDGPEVEFCSTSQRQSIQRGDCGGEHTEELMAEPPRVTGAAGLSATAYTWASPSPTSIECRKGRSATFWRLTKGSSGVHEKKEKRWA